jgi:hypothetical protein
MSGAGFYGGGKGRIYFLGNNRPDYVKIPKQAVGRQTKASL